MCVCTTCKQLHLFVHQHMRRLSCAKPCSSRVWHRRKAASRWPSACACTQRDHTNAIAQRYVSWTQLVLFVHNICARFSVTACTQNGYLRTCCCYFLPSAAAQLLAALSLQVLHERRSAEPAVFYAATNMQDIQVLDVANQQQVCILCPDSLWQGAAATSA